ncbi:MAG: hypothetical protein PHW69_08650 [Elusimicrobiaceae bacterium]|nr:hypothetical protein [Elusimicrobiaceae bacterium]
MRNITLLTALLACLFSGHAQSAPLKRKKTAQAKPARHVVLMPEGEWDARVTAVAGKVLLRPQGETLWMPIHSGFPIQPGDSLRTGAGALAEFSLDGKIYVDALDNTVLSFETLDYTGSTIYIEDGYVVGYAGPEAGLKSPVVFSAPTMLAQAVNTGFAFRYDSATKENTLACYGPGEIGVDRILEDGRAVRGVKIVRGRELIYGPDNKFLIAHPLDEFARYRPLAQKLEDKASGAENWIRMKFSEKAEIRDRVFTHAEAVYVRGFSVRDYRGDYITRRPTEEELEAEENKKYSVKPRRKRITVYDDAKLTRTGVRIATPSFSDE